MSYLKASANVSRLDAFLLLSPLCPQRGGIFLSINCSLMSVVKRWAFGARIPKMIGAGVKLCAQVAEI